MHRWFDLNEGKEKRRLRSGIQVLGRVVEKYEVLQRAELSNDQGDGSNSLVGKQVV